MNRMGIVLGLSALALAGCGEQAPSSPSERVTPVTAATVQSRSVERVERSIGRLRANAAPAVSAETGGRIRVIHADVGDQVAAGELLAEIDPERQQIAVDSGRAELRRLRALIENERRRVRRLSDLAARQSIPRDQLDEAETAVESLAAQIEAAQARLDDAEYNLRQTRILSPVAGRVQSRLVSEGDYVSPSMRVYELVSGEALRAFLPLPEHLQGEVSVGQVVTLSVPADPDRRMDAEVTDLRPSIDASSSAIELIVDVANPYGWRPGGSVTGRVVLDRREGVVVAPVSVVRRPAGEVVYVIEDDRVREQPVAVGLRGPDFIEILEGLEAGARVAVDGAGFLTDGARVSIRESGDGA